MFHALILLFILPLVANMAEAVPPSGVLSALAAVLIFPFGMETSPLPHLLILLQVRKLTNLIEMVSGKEANVAVHIGAQVVQIQRRSPGIRSVVVAAAPDRHTPMACSQGNTIYILFCISFIYISNPSTQKPPDFV